MRPRSTLSLAFNEALSPQISYPYRSYLQKQSVQETEELT